MTALLALEGLQVSYGGIRAVKGIDLTVGEGELLYTAIYPRVSGYKIG